jgi:uncharacterized damage-inducible protein DinB
MSYALRELMLGRWQQVRAGLLDTARKFRDAELTYRPASGLYTVGETLLHVAHEEAIEVHYGITGAVPGVPPAYDPSQYVDVASVLDVLAEVHATTVDYMQRLSDEALLSDVDVPWGMRAQQAEMLMHVLEHEVHHRGELSLMLGLLGKTGLDA